MFLKEFKCFVNIIILNCMLLYIIRAYFRF